MRLMSFCATAMVAAKIAVSAPTHVTTVSAVVTGTPCSTGIAPAAISG